MRLLRESDSFEKNNLTVQEWNKFYIELIVLSVLICTPENSHLLRSQKIRPGKQILPKQKKFNPVTHLHRLSFIRLIHSLSNGDNWISPKHNFMQHTRVLGCSQFTRCIPLSKKKAKIKKKSAGRSFCVSRKICVLQVYFTRKSWRQIWWCVSQSLKYTFYQCFYT